MDSLTWVLVMAAVAYSLLPVIIVARLANQIERDNNRKTFRVIFPAELKVEQVEGFLNAISGTLRPLPFRILGTSNLVFELMSTEHGLVHRVRVPWPQGSYVIKQLRSQMPGIRVTDERESDLPEWTRVVELGQSDINQALRHEAWGGVLLTAL
jgi:hypothetical protein